MFSSATMSKLTFTIVPTQHHPPPPAAPLTGLEWNCAPRKLDLNQMGVAAATEFTGNAGRRSGCRCCHSTPRLTSVSPDSGEMPLISRGVISSNSSRPTMNTCLFSASGGAAASLAEVSKVEGQMSLERLLPLKLAGLDGDEWEGRRVQGGRS